MLSQTLKIFHILFFFAMVFASCFLFDDSLVSRISSTQPCSQDTRLPHTYTCCPLCDMILNSGIILQRGELKKFLLKENCLGSFGFFLVWSAFFHFLFVCFLPEIISFFAHVRDFLGLEM